MSGSKVPFAPTVDAREGHREGCGEPRHSAAAAEDGYLMDERDQKIYTDVPVPERRKARDRSFEDSAESGRDPYAPDNGSSAPGVTPSDAAASGLNSSSTGAAASGRDSFPAGAASGRGRSPWNYISEEDLLQGLGRGFQDSFRERRLKEQEQYRAFREKVKNGETPSEPYVTRVRFARRWASELLGAERQESPEEGFRILESFGEEFPDGFTLSGYPQDTLREIKKLYVIVADLPRSYVAKVFADEIAEDEKILALIMYREADQDQLYRAISELGRYKGEKSHFFQEYQDDMKKVLARVYTAWADAWEEQHGRPLSTDLLGECDSRVWYPYQALHMSVPPAFRKTKMVFPVDPVLIYRCRYGTWTITQYFPNIYGDRLLREQLGQICRETERLMRDADGYRKLKAADMDKDLRRLVAEAVGGYLKDREEAARPELKIDLKSLGEIRSDADYTREQLLAGEEEENGLAVFALAGFPENHAEGLPAAPLAEPPEDHTAESPAAPLAEPPETRTAVQPEGSLESIPPAPPSDRAEAALPSSFGLTADESEILRMLLAGEDPAPYIRAHRLFASIVADSINEKLFDEIGDSVLEETEEGLSLIEDYRQDLHDLTGF